MVSATIRECVDLIYDADGLLSSPIDVTPRPIHLSTLSAAIASVGNLRYDIEALTASLMSASRKVADAAIDEDVKRDAAAALDVWSADCAAANQQLPGARRKALYDIRADMIDMADWLDQWAGPSIIATANDDEVSFFALANVIVSRRMLESLPPDMKRRLRYISLCSGMEACTAALESIGADAEPVAFSEIEPAASAVLAHKWPEVPNVGDFTAIDWSVYRGKVDLLAGGTPCQSFSIAGRRLGLDDPRGNLAIHYLRVVNTVRPRWFFYENVPGLLSSGDGDDFRAFIGLAQEIGYSIAYRVLDAQYFGVPQRRRRLFVVGYSGADWRPPATALHEQEGQGWHFEPCRTTRKKTAPRSQSSVNSRINIDGSAYTLVFDQDGYGDGNTVPCLTRKGASCHGGSMNPILVEDRASVMAFQSSQDGIRLSNVHRTLRQPRWVCRRLTPLECLRLQGFPDDWLDGVTVRRKQLSNSAKYKLLGNSWAVPVAAWILDRIIKADDLMGFAPSVNQVDAIAHFLNSHGFDIWETSEHRISAFVPESDVGLLIVGWDNRGPLVIIIDRECNPGDVAHPIMLESALENIQKRLAT